MKLGRQYSVKSSQPQYVNFIACEHSYYKTTLRALSMSSHVGRRAPYLPILSSNIYCVSAYNAYRQRHKRETDATFVACKADELDKKF